MLRLIHAYLLARQPNPSYTRIESIASRVKAMIGPCADVDALLLRAALIRGGELPPVRFASLPMLREGLLAIVEASHKMPELIPPDSLLEYACVERLVDSPISSWSVQLNRIEPRYLDSDDWLTNSIEDLAMQSHGDMATLDATTIARELGVPTRAVTTRIEVTRERMTRKDGRSVSSTADTSSQETKPINDMMPDGASIPSIPGYQLERVIGKGGMGEVYLAKHIATETLTAVKVFKQNAGVSIKAMQRFSREIDTLAVLQHDRIIKLLDHGYANGCFFFAMPYYERGNVADWARRHGAPTIEDAVRIIRDVLEGLACAHERGYVHRDIKPQNLLLDNQNRVLLADFGLAKEFEKSGKVDAKERSGSAPITTVDPRRNPRWMGTPAFMPEEQTLYFANVRPSTDVWSLAAVLYWLLCGFTPRDRLGGEIAPRNQVIPIRERRPDLPLGLSKLLGMALSSYPDKRPPDASAFRSLLEEALKGRDIEHLDKSRTALAPAIDDAVYPLRWRTEYLDREQWYTRLPRAPGKSPFQVKGLAYKGLLHFVTKKLEGGVGALAASMPNAVLRDYITQTFLASTFYDVLPLVTASAAAANLVNIPLETFAQNQGRAQALYDVGHAFRAFVQGRSIEDFPSRCKLIASRYYNFGEWEATSGSPRTVTFVVKGIPAWASPWFAPMLGGYVSAMVQCVAKKNASCTVHPTRRDGTTDGIQTVIVEMDISF
jgi:serine/threonine protein kinase